MTKVKKDPKKKVDAYTRAITMLISGHGLPAIHKELGISLIDLRQKALADLNFKKELDRAASGYENHWRTILLDNTKDNTDFKKNELLYKECLKDVQEIRRMATETVENIEVFLVDSENNKKKIQSS